MTTTSSMLLAALRLAATSRPVFYPEAHIINPSRFVLPNLAAEDGEPVGLPSPEAQS